METAQRWGWLYRLWARAAAPARRALNGLAQGRPGLLLGAVLLVVLLLFVPVPALLLDVLLVANLLFAGVLLAAAAGAGGPLGLPQFPALLITAVLLRLGLNVAAVRLILVDGYAGRVIDACASVVARGEPLVGLVVLLIVGAVQYLVLARGGERTAEVAARFVLDALPGRQAAIEADLRSGALSTNEAQSQRAALHREAQIYGAMDGALRFVKGDVLAGLLVLLVGLVGGLLIGVLSHGMGLGEAAAKYALLTIGDGLVTQVPVLLSTAAAGLLLTRGAARAADAATEPAPTAALLVRADPALGLTEAAAAQAVGALAAQLGVPAPGLTVFDAETPPRGLRVQLYGAPLLARTLAAGEAPLPLLTAALRDAAAELLTLDGLQQLLTALQAQHPTLVRETVPRRVELPRLAALCRRLLSQRVWPLDLRAVLQALSALPKPEGDLDLLTEQVRAGLGRHLLGGYLGSSAADSGLPALVLDAAIEQVLRDARRGDGEALDLEPELSRDITAAILAAKAQAEDAVLLCRGDVRRPLEQLLLATPSALPVFSYNELPASLPVLVRGRVEPGSGE